ncbi:hypothetical protein SAMN05428949_0850 [Chitinophaga sp. YR627]|uniref:hypothetical protein n=1 Tax=Chitinophaga sp. YR627 TaxID=1881041 RepID=UPI0008F1068A|nr:hypothetical protein [Chitinophaga sp. YR627]SFM80333.1 hypothetical protein SAMN05428949_0850 [Chitinophaga sp. YR627]
MSQYLTFRKLESEEEAQAIRQLLTAHDIPSELEINKALLDTTFIGQQFDPPYRVKIPADMFTKAEALVRNSVAINLEGVEPDYYLLSFTREELLEVVEKKDEWGNYDYALALHLLKDKGVVLTENDLQQIDKRRVSILSKPEEGNRFWIFIGYFSAAFGGALGMFIGVFMLRTQKTLPDGTRVYAFGEGARKHGKYILITGVTALAFAIFPLLSMGITLPVGLLIYGIFALTQVHF